MGCEDGGVVGGIRLGRLARETSQPTLLSLTLRQCLCVCVLLAATAEHAQ